MGNFNPKDYEMVADRLPKFYEQYPDGRVITDLVSDPADLATVIFKATLYATADEQERNLPLATGWAFEREGQGMVNKTSHLENCETSAIGRALANLTIHGAKRPSAEEMSKVAKAEKPAPAAPTVATQEQLARFKELIAPLGIEQKVIQAHAREKYGRKVQELTAPELGSVLTHFTKLKEAA